MKVLLVALDDSKSEIEIKKVNTRVLIYPIYKDDPLSPIRVFVYQRVRLTDNVIEFWETDYEFIDKV